MIALIKGAVLMLMKSENPLCQLKLRKEGIDCYAN